MSNVFFTSDPHIGHRLVAGFRWSKFTDTLQPLPNPVPEQIVMWHDKKLGENWDKVVKPDDIVWVLGDLSVGGKAREQAALDWIAARNGTKHLIVGNHDSPHPMHRDSHKAQKRYMEYFDSVQQAATRRINLPGGIRHKDVRLSHYPYFADRGEVPRDMQWRLRDEGDYLMHGHLHVPTKFKGREIHVGLDAWDLTPVPLEVIADYVAQREGEKCDLLNAVSVS